MNTKAYDLGWKHGNIYARENPDTQMVGIKDWSDDLINSVGIKEADRLLNPPFCDKKSFMNACMSYNHGFNDGVKAYRNYQINVEKEYR